MMVIPARDNFPIPFFEVGVELGAEAKRRWTVVDARLTCILIEWRCWS